MAGHSKWANIKHRKTAQDNKRGKVFSRCIRDITIAARINPNPEDNPALRTAIAKAYSGNMSKNTIEDAIAKASGNKDDINNEEVLYEGYGGAGLALLIDTLTNNRNRTVGEVRHALSRAGGDLAQTGAVKFQFKYQSEIFIPQVADEDSLLEIALHAGAEDVLFEEGGALVFGPIKGYFELDAALRKHYTVEASELVYTPQNPLELTPEQHTSALELIEALKNLDDVQEVYSNLAYQET